MHCTTVKHFLKEFRRRTSTILTKRQLLICPPTPPPKRKGITHDESVVHPQNQKNINIKVQNGAILRFWWGKCCFIRIVLVIQNAKAKAMIIQSFQIQITWVNTNRSKLLCWMFQTVISKKSSGCEDVLKGVGSCNCDPVRENAIDFYQTVSMIIGPGPTDNVVNVNEGDAAVRDCGIPV